MSLLLPYPALPGRMQTPHGAREEGVKGVRDKRTERVGRGSVVDWKARAGGVGEMG